jgi:hypothetical protein
MKKALALVLASGLLFGVVAQASAAPKPVTVFEDPAGDADAAQGVGQSIPVGIDLAGGSIALNGKNLDFTVTHHDMPPTGTLPEFARFIWAFSVGGNDYRLIVKRIDVGKPDAVNGDGTERVGQASPDGHYRIEGDCIQDQSLPVGLVKCKTLGYITGAFDPATKSFTANVPLALIKAKAGLTVVGGAGAAAGICAICWIPHHAERSLNLTALDTAAQAVSYKIPKK